MSFFSIAKGFHKLSSHPPPELTQKEQDRLRAIPIHEDEIWNNLSITKDHDKKSSTWTGNFVVA